jgi:hypothetical protein
VNTRRVVFDFPTPQSKVPGVEKLTVGSVPQLLVDLHLDALGQELDATVTKSEQAAADMET